MADCPCSCHKAGEPCGICCAETVKKFLEPPDSKDKSKELLEKFLKGKR
jgi:hypothetical protein